MKSLNFFFLTTLILGFAFSFNSCNDEKDESPLEAEIMVASDIHLFDPSLLIADGTAFQTYLAQDRKLLKESKAIFESFIQTVLTTSPDVLLLAGDLTKDGEQVSHETVAAMLEELENAGIKVVVINGNHDVNNPDAMQYNGETESPVPTVTPEEFATIYGNYGYNDAVARDPNSLSYITEPVDGLMILALDVCHYNPQETAGSITDVTLNWALAQIDAAIADGKRVFGMMHHNLVEHYTGQKTFFPEYVLDNYAAVADTLIAHGLQVMFSGHYHANDITMREFNGKKIYDIETGSTVTWPCPYRVITLNDTLLSVTTDKIEEITGDIPGGVDFQTYAKDFLTNGMIDLATYMLMSPPYNIPEAYAVVIAPPFANGFVAHYAGDETPNAQDQTDMQTVSSIDPTLGAALGGLWLDLAPVDNTYSIVLK